MMAATFEDGPRKQVRIHDAELLSQLQGHGIVDVIDATGRVIGRIEYKPMSNPEVGPANDLLDSRRRDPKVEFFTAAEVEAHLMKRINDRRNP